MGRSSPKRRGHFTEHQQLVHHKVAGHVKQSVPMQGYLYPWMFGGRDTVTSGNARKFSSGELTKNFYYSIPLTFV